MLLAMSEISGKPENGTAYKYNFAKYSVRGPRELALLPIWMLAVAFLHVYLPKKRLSEMELATASCMTDSCLWLQADHSPRIRSTCFFELADGYSTCHFDIPFQ